MDNQECSVYMPPAIVLEMDLETRAGSENMIPFDPPIIVTEE